MATSEETRRIAADALTIITTGRAKGGYWAYNRRAVEYDSQYVRGDDLNIALIMNGWAELFGSLTVNDPPGGPPPDPTPSVQYMKIDQTDRRPQIGTKAVMDPPYPGVPRVEVRVPDDLLSLRYEIRTDGALTATIDGGRGKWLYRSAALPFGNHTHEITAVVEWEGGIVTRTNPPVTVKLREYAIASIGDSYASGQGCPDVEGSKGTYAGIACDATTLSKVVSDLKGKKWIRLAVAYSSKLYDIIMPDAVETLLASTIDAGEAIVDLTGMMFGRSVPIERDPLWLEPRAHRSLRSGHGLAALLFEQHRRPGEPNQRRHELDVARFLSFARTGSTVDHGLLGPRSDDHLWNARGQLDELIAATSDIQLDALLVSIGGNDAGFSDIVTQLTDDLGIAQPYAEIAATYGDTPTANAMLWGGAYFPDKRDVIREKATLFIEQQLEKKLRHVRDRIVGMPHPPRFVYVVEYPTGLFSRSAAGNPGWKNAGGCGVFESDFDIDIDTADAELLTELGVSLNTEIQRAVERFDDEREPSGPRWFFVRGVAEAFNGHGYCEPSVDNGGTGCWFVSMEESCRRQSDLLGALHPNIDGCKAIAEQILKSFHDTGLRNLARESTTVGRPPATTGIRPPGRLRDAVAAIVGTVRRAGARLMRVTRGDS